MHGRQALEIPAFQRRLDRQAASTRHLRAPIYERAGLRQAKRILDVGSGSGAVTPELGQWGAQVVAIDVDQSMAKKTQQRGQTSLQADGAALPFPDAHFDAAVCNLTLLWAPDPVAVIKEMARVVHADGVVLATMEPDYGGKVHWPANPLVDAIFQGEGVANRGGDPLSGRKLRAHFAAAGLDVEVGINNMHVPSPSEDLENFRRHRRYYRRLLAENGITAEQVDAWEEEYLEAIEAGTEMTFLPIFHAIGHHRSDLVTTPIT